MIGVERVFCVGFNQLETSYERERRAIGCINGLFLSFNLGFDLRLRMYLSIKRHRLIGLGTEKKTYF